MNTIEDTSEYAGVIYGLHTGDYNYRYVGKTHQKLTRRFSQHRYSANTGVKLPVYDWIRKHGVGNIHVCVLATFDEDTVHLIDEQEIFHISQNECDLNLTEGGGGTRGLSEESRAKISAATKGRVLTDEHKRKIGETSCGRIHSEKNRKMWSQLYTGEGNPYYGKKHSDEVRAKLSESHKGAFPEGMHVRWHVNRGVVNDECPRCAA